MATVDSPEASDADRPKSIDRARDPLTPAKLALMLGFLGFLAFVPTLGQRLRGVGRSR